jgi:uncharacterized protein YjbJ (UPF0337 family)
MTHSAHAATSASGLRRAAQRKVVLIIPGSSKPDCRKDGGGHSISAARAILRPDEQARARVLQRYGRPEEALMWNKDEVKRKADQAKGRAKEAVGDLTGDDRMRGEGAADEIGGDVQEAWGKGRRKVGKALDDLGDNIKK